MDEPLGALDRRLREELQYEIRRIHRDLGVTVLYVTHDQQEAMVMSDRVAVFRAGRIEQIASPEALYEEPERAFVARFIGENNRLSGRVTSDRRRRHLRRGRRRRGRPGAPGRLLPDPATRLTLSIRPERVAIAPERASTRTSSRPASRTSPSSATTSACGSVVCGRSDFIVKIPNMVGHGAVIKGDRIRIGWTPTDCRVLDADDEEGYAP